MELPKKLHSTFGHLFLAYALDCWTCDSMLQSFCGENWDKSKITDGDKRRLYGPCLFGKVCVKMVVRDDGGKFQSFRIYEFRSKHNIEIHFELKTISLCINKLATHF